MRNAQLQKQLAFGLLSLPFFLMSGCNHLFYYPDSLERRAPAGGNNVVEVHRIPTGDGEQLSLWHLSAPGPRKGLVVHFHGNAQNLTAHLPFVDWLPAEGFDVVTFDYRGYGNSTGSPSREGLVLDGEAVLRWVNAQPKFHSLPLFVLGQSLGGAVAVPALARVPETKVRALILDSTFASYRSVTRAKLASFWLTWPLQWPLSFLVSDDFSPRDFITRLNMPIVFLHSPVDPVVPYHAGQDLAEAAKPNQMQFWDIYSYGHAAALRLEDGPYRRQLVKYFTGTLNQIADLNN